MRLSLRSRLSLWAALATACSVVLVAAGLFFAVNSLLERSQLEQTLTQTRALSERLGNYLRSRENGLDPEQFFTGNITISGNVLEELTRRPPQGRDLEARLFSPQQAQAIATPRFPQAVPLNLPPGAHRLGEQIIVVSPLGRTGLVLTTVSDARALGQARRAFGQVLWWLLPLSLLLSLGVGYAVAGRLLRPIRQLEQAARAIHTGGDLRKPLPAAGEGDELSRLALTLQDTFGRLAASREREQDFLRAAAHDLRSPLAALSTRVQTALSRERTPERYRHELQELGTDIARLSDLTQHLLSLARNPESLRPQTVSLRDLAADAVDRARELSPDADIDLIAPEALEVQGDAVLLGQAIWNLTANALAHAPGAAVLVTVRRGDGYTEIEVSDDGPGVSAEVLARLGEAFYRPDSSRHAGGHGLGLALVRHAALLHGGSLHLGSQPGQGLQATIRLPSAKNPKDTVRGWVLP